MAAKNFPLFLNYRFPVVGHGFVVGITLKGRILVEEDGGEFWAYGVNPGGVSGQGGSVDAALAAFNAQMHVAINDLAEVARSHEEFAAEIRDSFRTNLAYERAWNEAILAVRNGSVDLPGMTREPADSLPSISVELIDSKSPADANIAELVTLAKAA